MKSALAAAALAVLASTGAQSADLAARPYTKAPNTLGVVTAFDVVRGGINYKFDWSSAPLVAKY